jgi:hypothetical protein
MCKVRVGKRWIAILSVALAGAGEAARADPGLECQLDEHFAPRQSKVVSAEMLGMASPEEVARQTRVAIERSHARLSPAYVSLPRILAVFIDASGRHQTIAAVLDGKIPRVGASIKLESRHRDPNQPCSFVPWTVVPQGTNVLAPSPPGPLISPAGSA